MSTTPDENKPATDADNSSANETAPSNETAAPEASAAATSESASEQAASSDAADNDAGNASSAKKILIGSQRDAADPAHGSRAIRQAPLAPENVGSAIHASSATVGPDDEGVKQTADAAAVAMAAAVAATPTPAAAQVATSAAENSDAGIDQELEAALGDLQMDSLMAPSANESSEEIEIDSLVKALVTRIHNENVFFSLKGRFEGIASMRSFKTPPEEGAMLEVRVTGFKEDEGLYEVNIPGASVSVADWSDLVEGAIIETKITGSNTGGLECMVNGIRGFIPASQIDIVRVENLGDFVNEKMQCIVVEVNPGRKKLVLSRRAILERERQEKKEELMQTLAVGQTFDGTVIKLMDFGAFVDIGGVEGLVHVSKISWDRVTHPKDVFDVGQKISVKIDKIHADTGKLSLSYRDTQENPWTNVDAKYPEGAVVSGTVSRIAQFGAFVKLEVGIEGLIHISELAHHRVMAVKNIVKQGDVVSVKVLSVDPSAQKIGLSLKATQAKPEKAGDKKSEEPEDTPIRKSVVKKRTEPLKGGHDKGSGGEQFGLNW